MASGELDAVNDARVEQFRSRLLEERYARVSVRIYTAYVRRALAAFVDEDLEGASSDALREWWSTLPPTPASRNQARKALIAFFDYAGIDPNPARSLPGVPARDGVPRPLTVDERSRFRAAVVRLGGAHKVLGLVLDETACRFSELRFARWSQFDLGDEDACWWVSGKGSGRRGPKERPVPLTGALVGVLRGWRAATGSPDWVFPRDADETQPATEHWVRDHFAEICDAAGIEGVVPHRIRHTTASRWLDATGDLAGVQDLLGHASPASTRIYTRVSRRRLRSIVEGDL